MIPPIEQEVNDATLAHIANNKYFSASVDLAFAEMVNAFFPSDENQQLVVEAEQELIALIGE
jgi:hypothetical protein